MKANRAIVCVGMLGLVSSLSLLFVTGCSLQAKDQRTEIFIDLSEITSQANHESTNRGVAQPSIATTPAPAPTSVADFDCLAINVIGPGIPLAPGSGGNENLQSIYTTLLTPTSASCSYLGAHSRPVLKTGAHSVFPAHVELSLEVPAGNRRIIQIVGIVEPPGETPKVCKPNGFIGGINDDGVGYYEITRHVIFDLFSPKSITLSSQWPDATNTSAHIARLMNCGDLINTN